TCGSPASFARLRPAPRARHLAALQADDRAAAVLAGEDRGEGGVEIFEADFAGCGVTGAEGSRDAMPGLDAIADRRLGRVDSQQGDSAQDEREHRRLELDPAGVAGGGHRSAVAE